MGRKYENRPKNKHFEKKENNSMKIKKCTHCGGKLSLRGAFGASGQRRWKCKSCGRTVREQKKVVAPIPLVPFFANVEA